MKRKDYFLLIGILLIHLLLLMALRFTAWPEMSLWPYLVTKGWLPYRDIAIVHTPLMILDLTLFYKIFGVGIAQLKIFTWVLILASDLLIFFVVKKLWNKKVAFLSLIAYGMWLVFYDGNGLWFDLYMGVLAFCSFYFVKEKKWLSAGIFWALAFWSKQTAVWFLIPILFEMIDGKWLTIKNILRRPLKIGSCKVVWRFVIGFLVVTVPFLLLLFIFHLLPSFWNWAVKFGIFELPRASGQVQFPAFRTLALALFPFLIFIPSFLNHKFKFLNLALWAFAGVLGAYPRFEYFHFQPALSYLAIAVAIVIQKLHDDKNAITKIFIPVYLLVSLVLFGIFLHRNFGGETRFYEKDVKEVADYIKYNTNPGDKIFVLNWWDNLYALTDTLPATRPWIPQLSWYTENTGIQEQMVENLSGDPPKLVVYNPYTGSGLSSYVPKKVYGYVMGNYFLDARVENVEILIR